MVQLPTHLLFQKLRLVNFNQAPPLSSARQHQNVEKRYESLEIINF